MPDRWKQADELKAHVKELNFAAEEYRRREVERTSYGTFVVGYLLLLSGGLLLVVVLHRVSGADPYAIGVVFCGVLYLLGALQRPRIVYLLLRQMWWFLLIRDPRWMRAIMAFIGVGLVLFGLLTPVAELLGKR